METTEPHARAHPHGLSDAERTAGFDEQRRALCHAFCLESAERLGRVRSALERLAQGAPPAEALDRIHQELDSLYGAARAVDLPRAAWAYRTVAAHARLLRRGLPRSLLGTARDRLEAAVAALPKPDSPCTELCTRRLEARALSQDPIRGLFRDLPDTAEGPANPGDDRCHCRADNPPQENEP